MNDLGSRLAKSVGSHAGTQPPGRWDWSPSVLAGPATIGYTMTIADQVIKLLRSTYADFGPTLAAEKLRERHGIDLAVETVRSLMTAGGLWLLRPPKVQQLRSRRACIGELVQIDGCEVDDALLVRQHRAASASDPSPSVRTIQLAIGLTDPLRWSSF